MDQDLDDDEKDLIARCLKLREQLETMCVKEGLTIEQVFFGGRPQPKKAPGANKYRDPDQHDFTWDGQGRTPIWYTKHLENGMKQADLLNPAWKGD